MFIFACLHVFSYYLMINASLVLIGENCELLTHWGRATHICVNILTIISLDNGLSPDRRQAFIWINAGILLNGPSGTNFSEILTQIHTFSSKKMHLKISSGKWRPLCLGLNVLSMHCIWGALSPKTDFRILWPKSRRQVHDIGIVCQNFSNACEKFFYLILQKINPAIVF